MNGVKGFNRLQRNHSISLSVKAESIIRVLMRNPVIKKRGLSDLLSWLVIDRFGESDFERKYFKLMVVKEQVVAEEHRARSCFWANQLEKRIKVSNK